MSKVLEMARVVQFRGCSELEWLDFVDAATWLDFPELPAGVKDIQDINTDDPDGGAWFDLACDVVEKAAIHGPEDGPESDTQAILAASARQLLRALAREEKDIGYHAPVWEALSRVRDDFSMMQTFCALLRAHLLWT